MKKIPPVTPPINTKAIITINSIAAVLFNSGGGPGQGAGPGHGSAYDILYNKIK